jgi:hypothetical protein
MHLLCAAECIASSCVFVTIYLSIIISINTLSAAAAEAGAAASRRDQQKRNAYVRVELNGCAFVPFSVKSYRR